MVKTYLPQKRASSSQRFYCLESLLLLLTTSNLSGAADPVAPCTTKLHCCLTQDSPQVKEKIHGSQSYSWGDAIVKEISQQQLVIAQNEWLSLAFRAQKQLLRYFFLRTLLNFSILCILLQKYSWQGFWKIQFQFS